MDEDFLEYLYVTGQLDDEDDDSDEDDEEWVVLKLYMDHVLKNKLMLL